MSNTEKVLQLFARYRYRHFVQNEQYRKEFYQDINFINFSRLRVWSYFMLLFVSYQLYTDFFLNNFWETRQVSYFMILDLILALVSITTLILTHFRFPGEGADMNRFRILYTHGYVIFQLIWSSAVSIVESQTASSVPTYLLGVFSATTIFLIRGINMFVYMLISLIVLIFGLILNGLSTESLFTQYYLIFILILAWITSRALFNTRLRSFNATKEIELAKNSLDKTVKERTAELRETNQKLVDEIVERKRYEKNLELEKKHAEEADKLKSVFLANMSHEIRTPLNGILGFGDLLRNEDLSHEKKIRYLDIVHANGQQLLKIIDDIMDISMIESNQLKVNRVSFRLNHIFHDALVFFKTFKQVNGKEDLEIVYENVPDDINDRIYSDPTRVQQVLYNLLSNGVKFTEKGYVKFGLRVEQGIVLVYIEDTGIGIKQGQQDKVFLRFRQGEESMTRSFGGTGLGLSISKGLVELLGGLIWLDNTYQRGARFCFTLPTEDHINKENLGFRVNTSVLKKREVGVICRDEMKDIVFVDIFKKYKASVTLQTSFDFEKENDFEVLLFCYPENIDELKENIKRSGFDNIFIAILIPRNFQQDQVELLPNISFLKEPVNVQVLLMQTVNFLETETLIDDKIL